MKKMLILSILFFCTLLFQKIDASVLLMVEAEGIVDGYTGENIGSKSVELSLSEEGYRFEIENDEEITDWFTNIPEGLEAYAVRHDDRRILVSIEGTPLETSDEQIDVNVPDGCIIDENSEDSIGDLHNTPSGRAVYAIGVRVPYAEYDRPSTVAGTVGEQLVSQKVYIRLHHTTCEVSMTGHEFPAYNGLLPKVIEVLPENVIIVEYTGIPLEKDDSLIHTVLMDEDLKCDQDLSVPDREDVHFAIGKREEEIPVIIPEKTPEFVIPYTGIE